MVKGNHDEQASLVESSRDFNELAEHAINWTRENLTDPDKEWLRDLRLQRQVRDFTIVHATLDTPAQWGYVLNNLDAAASFTYQHTTVCFFGHTHFPVAYVRDGGVHRFRSDLLMIGPEKNISSTPAASASRAMAIGAPPIASTTRKKCGRTTPVNTTSLPRRKKY